MNLTGYALIAGLLGFMGLGLVAYHYKVEAQDAIVQRDQAVRDKDAAVAVNEANKAAMAKLEADRIASEKLATELQDQIDASNKTALDLATNLSELRAHNAAVNDYLNGVIPDDVLRLYNKPETLGSH